MFRFNLWARGPFFHPGASAPGGLETPPYPLPAHLASPALLNLAGDRAAAAAAAAAAGLPLGSSHHGDKDKDTPPTVPISATGFPALFRPGEPLPAGLYSPLHQQFLRAQLDLAAAHSQARAAAAGAMSPESGDPISPNIHPSFILNSHPSAFAPASKRPKYDSDREEGEVTRGDDVSERFSGPPTPASPSSRQSGTPTDRAGSGLDLTLDSSHRGSPHSTGVRSPAAAAADGLIYCPVCRCRLEPEELDSHLAREMTELTNMYRKFVCENGTKENPMSNHLSNGAPSKSRYDTYLRIRGNRENRLGKLRGSKRKRLSDESLYNGNEQQSNTHETSFEEEQIDIVSCDDKTDTTTTGSPVKSSPGADGIKCASCKEPFSKCSPMASTTCWHVYCLRCWDTDQQSCCPQCRQPVSPSDLRRIYLS